MKKCCHCKQEKPLSDFNKNRSKYDGYAHNCKVCARQLVIFSRKKLERRESQKLKRQTIEYKEKRNQYMRFIGKNNPLIRLNRSIRKGIGKSLRKSKNGRHWESLVGYTIDELKQHLESKFQPGMSWENYGKYSWHIDHIRPKSSFSFNSTEDLEFKQCWSLSNLQPLWATDNLKKYNKLVA